MKLEFDELARYTQEERDKWRSWLAAHPDALARAILDYFGDRAIAHRHAKAAHRVTETRFSLATMVAAYASVYERALTAAGVALPALRDGIGAPLASPESASLQRASLP